MERTHAFSMMVHVETTSYGIVGYLTTPSKSAEFQQYLLWYEEFFSKYKPKIGRFNGYLSYVSDIKIRNCKNSVKVTLSVKEAKHFN